MLSPNLMCEEKIDIPLISVYSMPPIQLTYNPKLINEATVVELINRVNIKCKCFFIVIGFIAKQVIITSKGRDIFKS